MQLHEATQVKEVYSPQDANDLLSKGWKLLAVTSATNPKSPQFVCVVYVLGQ